MKRLAIILALALGSAGAYAQGSPDSSGDTSTTDSQSEAPQASDAGTASSSTDPGSAAERLGGTGSSSSGAMGDSNDTVHPEDRDDDGYGWDREGE